MYGLNGPEHNNSAVTRIIATRLLSSYWMGQTGDNGGKGARTLDSSLCSASSRAADSARSSRASLLRSSSAAFHLCTIHPIPTQNRVRKTSLPEPPESPKRSNTDRIVGGRPRWMRGAPPARPAPAPANGMKRGKRSGELGPGRALEGPEAGSVTHAGEPEIGDEGKELQLQLRKRRRLRLHRVDARQDRTPFSFRSVTPVIQR